MARGLETAFEAAALWLTRAAAAFLVAMMLVTVADIVLRAVFDFPVFGTFDLVELFLVTLVYLAIPETFLRREHVVVEIVDRLVSARALAVLKALASLTGLALLVAMEVKMVQPALDMYAFGDRTLDLSIPKIVHWVPILLGIGCSVLAMTLILLRDVAAAVGRAAS